MLVAASLPFSLESTRCLSFSEFTTVIITQQPTPFLTPTTRLLKRYPVLSPPYRLPFRSLLRVAIVRLPRAPELQHFFEPDLKDGKSGAEEGSWKGTTFSSDAVVVSTFRFEKERRRRWEGVVICERARRWREENELIEEWKAE